MKVFHTRLHIETTPGVDVFDISQKVQQSIDDCGVKNGVAIIGSQHTTTAITINENEPRLIDDVKTFFERLIPEDDRYLHNDIHLRDCPQDEPKNAHSHLTAMLLGSSESVAIVAGRLMLGRWQSIMLVELDGARQRTVSVQVMGV